MSHVGNAAANALVAEGAPVVGPAAVVVLALPSWVTVLTGAIPPATLGGVLTPPARGARATVPLITIDGWSTQRGLVNPGLAGHLDQR